MSETPETEAPEASEAPETPEEQALRERDLPMHMRVGNTQNAILPGIIVDMEPEIAKSESAPEELKD